VRYRYEDYARKLQSYTALAEVAEYGRVLEGGREYPLYRLVVPGERWLVITAGFHGEEPAGPLTLAEHFAQVVEWAREQGVGLRVYPCLNPSGFEDGTRYNRSGEHPNNDFLRYEKAPGLWVEQVAEGEHFLRWALYGGGPQETVALRQELVRYAPPAAALDLHQDNYLHEPATYAYTFGDPGRYLPLVESSRAHAKVLRNSQVDEHHVTNAEGLIVAHDGSVTDWYMRQGVPWVATLETTTCTPMEACHAINLIWIRGFIELAAQGSAQ
jgi:hypothetical protein